MSRMMLAWLTGSRKAANSSRGTSLIVSMETNRSLKVTTLQTFLLLLKTNFTKSRTLNRLILIWRSVNSLHFLSGHLKVKLGSMTVDSTNMQSCEPRRIVLADVSRREKKKHLFRGVKQQPEIRKDSKAD